MQTHAHTIIYREKKKEEKIRLQTRHFTNGKKLCECDEYLLQLKRKAP